MESSFSDDVTLDAAVPRQSNFLSKEDVGAGKVVTIAGMSSTEIEGDHGSEIKTILKFQEQDVKPLVLNQTNKELLKVITGGRTVGDVKGKKIEVFNDHTIMFGGKMTGGIRIRAAHQPSAQAQSNEVPF